MAALTVARTVLPHRGVLQLSGRDALKFYHAMSTNNSAGLDAPGSAQYTAFLGTKGRVLFDTVALRASAAEEPTLLLEMDRGAIPKALAHMKEYKMRSKVKFVDVSDTTAVHVASEPFAGSFADPRAPLAGLQRGFVDAAAATDSAPNAVDEYLDGIFSRGVGEGASAFTEDKTLPFEGNLDFLDGVSFHKGCYLGQELTHRTHVMLVTRKRLLPLELVGGSMAAVAPGATLAPSADPTASAGRIIGIGKRWATGLVRLRTLGGVKVGAELTCGDALFRTTVPDWWPEEGTAKSFEEVAPTA